MGVNLYRCLIHIKEDYCDTDMTLLTVTNYILYLRHWIFNKNNMTGVISGTGTAYTLCIIWIYPRF
jgi:hypothetical protein